MINLLKRNSNTDVFPWKLLSFLEHLFHRTTLMASEVFYKDFIDISYKSASFHTLEDSRSLSIFLTIIVF